MGSPVAGQPKWPPKRIDRVVKVISTSTSPAYVKTDCGYAYAKAMGNREGNHVLACEWVGTRLAQRLGLPILDAAFVPLDEACCWPLREDDPKAGRMEPGPAFLTRAVDATTWDGGAELLRATCNPDDLAGLVTVDTWLRNDDRCSPDEGKQNVRNVLLVEEAAPPGKFRVVAMDFTHALTGGHPFSRTAMSIDRIRDERVYGCFPAFRPYVRKTALQPFADRLGGIRSSDVSPVVDSIPSAWGPSPELRARLVRFVVDRAAFVAETIVRRVEENWQLASEGPR